MSDKIQLLKEKKIIDSGDEYQRLNNELYEAFKKSNDWGYGNHYSHHRSRINNIFNEMVESKVKIIRDTFVSILANGGIENNNRELIELASVYLKVMPDDYALELKKSLVSHISSWTRLDTIKGIVSLVGPDYFFESDFAFKNRLKHTVSMGFREDDVKFIDMMSKVYKQYGQSIKDQELITKLKSFSSRGKFEASLVSGLISQSSEIKKPVEKKNKPYLKGMSDSEIEVAKKAALVGANDDAVTVNEDWKKNRYIAVDFMKNGGLLSAKFFGDVAAYAAFSSNKGVNEGVVEALRDALEKGNPFFYDFDFKVQACSNTLKRMSRELTSYSSDIKYVDNVLKIFGQDVFCHKDHLLESSLSFENGAAFYLLTKYYGKRNRSADNETFSPPVKEFADNPKLINSLILKESNGEIERDSLENLLSISDMSKIFRDKDKAGAVRFLDFGEDYIAIKNTKWSACSTDKASVDCDVYMNGVKTDIDFDTNTYDIMRDVTNLSLKSDSKFYQEEGNLNKIYAAISDARSATYCPDNYTSEVLDNYMGR